jgi:hypothetical protein
LTVAGELNSILCILVSRKKGRRGGGGGRGREGKGEVEGRERRGKRRKEERRINLHKGHNGAGKTSTLNMLMGAFRPTSGDAMLFGRSAASDIDLVRQRIGVCSQFGNSLFNFCYFYYCREHGDFCTAFG